jgi:signal transduction histidine kinase
MLGRMLGKRYDERRLRLVLALLFLALAIPTGAVLWQAYGQLKWESFHLYRNQAEELTGRIDSAISQRLAEAEAQGFAEYSFLNVSGNPDAGFLQRSPLSAFPVVQDVPGAIGYFQVDAQGQLSTPLLPESGTDSVALGIGAEELSRRQSVVDRIRDILKNNRLVEGRETAGEASAEFFDELGQSRDFADQDRRDRALASRDELQEDSEIRANQYSKISELRLDDALERKAESVEEVANEADAFRQAASDSPSLAAKRARRTEQAALPEPMAPAGARVGEPEMEQPPRISTFESEVDPFEFSLLDSGEFVLFRKVWKDGERFVQGVLIDREAFLEETIVSAYQATALSNMSSLVVGFGEDVLRIVTTRDAPVYDVGQSGFDGDLLYRGRLTAPADQLELIFTVTHLPAGPGASVLGWTSLVLAAVFLGGFLLLYRLGLGQIRLARQQQDFVSSVSHELKTPLTSIRMYSEMLREGWADDAKRDQYYEFIHDESERLSRLISNVLQLASITRNDPNLDIVPVSMEELLDRIRSKISSQVESAGFELVIEADSDSRGTQVELDQDCMMQIIINLVDNAIKFSRNAETRKVEVAARVTGDKAVRFSVRDFGPGIPREQMKKIFRLFYRPESELTRETVGTGIGLAIVHQLTIAMGGKVDVLNRDPGAEFGVTFPQFSS